MGRGERRFFFPNHRITKQLRLAGPPGVHLVPPCSSRDAQSRVPRATSRRLLKISRGDPTTSRKCLKKDLQFLESLWCRSTSDPRFPPQQPFTFQPTQCSLGLGRGGAVCLGYGFGFFFPCCFDFFVLFYGHLLLVEIFKSVLSCAPMKRVFSSSCTSLFTNEARPWVSDDLRYNAFFFFFLFVWF